MPDRTESRELSRRLTVALVIPVALLTITGVLLALQVLRVADDAAWVDHSDAVIAQASKVEKQILDQETGLRGYLLTEDRAFLEPFEKARPTEELAVLRGLVKDNGGQSTRADEIGRLYQFWISQNSLLLQPSAPAAARAKPSMLEGKREMDQIRGAMTAFLEAENALRHTRAADLTSSTTTTKFVFVGLFGAIAVVLAFASRQQLAAIAQTFRAALDAEAKARREVEREDWLRAGHVKLSEALLGELTMDQLGQRALLSLLSYLKGDVGAFFVSEGGRWQRRAGYGVDDGVRVSFGPSEGLIGAAATSGELLHKSEVPADFFKVRSGTGEHAPVEIVIVPARIDDKTFAVLELGFLGSVGPEVLALLARIGENLALAVRSAEHRERLRDLYEEAQRQAEELQAQQEELRVSNEELHAQTAAIRAAHEDAERRQKELEEINSRLEEQTNALHRSQREIAEKAAELERASRYKSEFLANMSHELRTPLNSALLLAKLLSDNKDGNLTEEQVRFAKTISAAGNDLLTLINDVLDLSKIEAGHVEIHPTRVSLDRLFEALKRAFEPMAEDKGLSLTMKLGADAPETLESDAQRVEQILKNLLSNAIKFTDQGEVSLEVLPSGPFLRFVVKDTGIGIAEENQALIFEAFRQADAGSTRRYGGTGLGLSISRDLAKLLGGHLEVESTPGKGSVFTFTVPRQAPQRAQDKPSAAWTERAAVAARGAGRGVGSNGAQRADGAHAAFEDDRAHVDPQRRVILVIEDDVAFAKILFDLAHAREFQCIVAHNAESGWALAKEYLPTAVLLDMMLPDHSGLSVLDLLKHDPRTRHIPVHVVSAGDYAKETLAMGAAGYISKPAKHEHLVSAFKSFEARLSGQSSRLLIVEDDPVQLEASSKLLASPTVEIVGVGTVNDALAALRRTPIDCVVTDLTLPDGSGFELLDKMEKEDGLGGAPVIVYTGRSLSVEEEQRLRKHSSSIIVKGARSPERLVDEVTLFLHQIEAELPPERRRMLKVARDRDAVFDGRRVLIVEDDVRNIFSLSSVLEPQGMKISIARNGKEALRELANTPDVDVVLMDIMMPEMDGLEAIRRIRQNPDWARLPIIAITAKAMKDDQERCMQAGANDYVPKPIDVEMLLSLLRIWMPK